MLDRFHIIQIDDYTAEERATILRDYAFSRMKRDKGIPNVYLSDSAADLLISKLDSPGARGLEKACEKIGRDYILFAKSEDPLKVYESEDILRIFNGIGPKTRYLVSKPGQAEFVYQNLRGASFGVIQATAVPGTGRIQILGSMTETQKEYCKVAFLAVKSCVAPELERMDTTLFSVFPVAELTGENVVGMAAFASILSLLTQKALTGCCFCGGVDISAGTYFIGDSLSDLIKATGRAGKVLFAPFTPPDDVKGKRGMVCSSYDARVLFELAQTNNGTPS